MFTLSLRNLPTVGYSTRIKGRGPSGAGRFRPARGRMCPLARFPSESLHTPPMGRTTRLRRGKPPGLAPSSSDWLRVTARGDSGGDVPRGGVGNPLPPRNPRTTVCRPGGFPAWLGPRIARRELVLHVAMSRPGAPAGFTHQVSAGVFSFRGCTWVPFGLRSGCDLGRCSGDRLTAVSPP